MKDRILARMATALLLTTAANAVYAGSGPYNSFYRETLNCPALNCGFYVGAQAGYDAYRIKQTLTSSGGNFSTTASLTGWLGGLFIGYGQYFYNNFYLGGEFLANYNGTSQVFATGTDDDGDGFNRSHKVNGTLGLAVIPGVKLNSSTLGYIRLGYDWTRFKDSITAINGGGPTVTFSNSVTLGGFDFGFGIETVVCDNISIRTQYDHVWYSNKSTTLAPGTPLDTGASVTVRPSDNQVTLGVLYHFA